MRNVINKDDTPYFAGVGAKNSKTIEEINETNKYEIKCHFIPGVSDGSVNLRSKQCSKQMN